MGRKAALPTIETTQAVLHDYEYEDQVKICKFLQDLIAHKVHVFEEEAKAAKEKAETAGKLALSLNGK